MKKNNTTRYRVLIPFRYPLNDVIQWHYQGTEIALPSHAAAILLRQGKIEEI